MTVLEVAFQHGALPAAVIVSAALVLLWFGASRTRFDRDSSRLHYVPKLKWRSVSRPLSDIVVVQFIEGGVHSDSDDRLSYRTYQLNLVLDDPAEPRINLCDHTDVAWQFQTGQEIAAFLDRPFIDLVSN